MSRWRGGIIRSSLPVVSGGKYGNASGIFTVTQHEYYVSQNTWPQAASPPIVGTGIGAYNICCAGANISVTINTCPGGAGAVVTHTAVSNVGGYSAVITASGNTFVAIGAGGTYTFTVISSSRAGTVSTSASNPITIYTDASSGYFTSGCSTTYNIYTYSNDTVTGPTISGAASSRSSSGAGNSSRAIVAAGATPAYNVGSSTRYKYIFSSSSTAGAASAGAATYSGAAVGNSTRGIFALGQSPGCLGSSVLVTTREKYTYSGDSRTSATDSSVAGAKGAATGNSTFGLFQLGYAVPGTYSPLRNKYTYSNDTQSAGTTASGGSYYVVATGNSTFGIFALGIRCPGPNNIRDKYTYSNDTQSNGTAASGTNTWGGQAAGNSCFGIFRPNQPAIATDKYTYSNCAQVSGASLTPGTFSCSNAAFPNGVAGVGRG
jgi:hypothetical protein